MQNEKIINGDALEVLKTLPDESIDCIVTDPPWSYSSYGQFPNRNLIYSTVDDEYLYLAFKELFRTLKDKKHAYIFTTNLRLGKDICMLEKAGFTYNQTLVLLANGIKLGYGYRHQYIPIIFLSKNGTVTTNYHNISNVLGPAHFNVLSKPVEIIKTLIVQSTTEGDVVIDPFLGSGSTAVACKLSGRQCIGVEIDPKTYRDAGLKIESTVPVSLMEQLYEEDE